MNCPKCGTPMIDGQAIQTSATNYRACFHYAPTITYATLEIIPCMKCPSCGHSDDGVDPKKLISVENHNV